MGSRVPNRRDAGRLRRHSRLARLIVTVLFVGFTASCLDQSRPPSMSGVWSGRDGDRAVLLRIVDTDGELTGSGSIENPDAELLVEGTRAGSDVGLDVTAVIAGGYAFGRLQGELRGNILVGQLSGLAFETNRIVLLRP